MKINGGRGRKRLTEAEEEGGGERKIERGE